MQADRDAEVAATGPGSPAPSDREPTSTRGRIPEVIRFGGAIALTSLVASAFAILFRASLGAVHAAFGARDVVEALRSAPVWARVLLPAFGGWMAGLVILLVGQAPAGGVAQVMEAVVLGKTRLSARVTVLKSLASWAAIAAGGSIGREGPLIQFGGASGSLVGTKLGLSPTRLRALIAAGTAAGFAAAYNTPFAAVLFVLEVVSGVAALDLALPTVLATVLATAVTRAFVGPGPIYGVRAFNSSDPLDLLLYAVLGVIAAFGILGFRLVLTWGERMFSRSAIPLPWRAGMGGLVCGAIIAFVPDVAGNGYEPLNQILDVRMGAGLVAVVLVGKCFATSASVSSGSPGGVFTPMLLVGGGCGFLYGKGLELLSIGSAAGAGSYALVGMSAAIAASTHAPLMAAVMVFELSGDYAIVLPLLLATALATAISRRVRARSIYEDELAARGIRWEVTMEGRRALED